MIVLQILLNILMVVVFGVGCITVLAVVRAAIEDHPIDRAHRVKKRPEPVNAIADYATWKHDRRVADRAKWDTEFYELEHGALPAGVRRAPGGGYYSSGGTTGHKVGNITVYPPFPPNPYEPPARRKT